MSRKFRTFDHLQVKTIETPRGKGASYEACRKVAQNPIQPRMRIEQNLRHHCVFSGDYKLGTQFLPSDPAKVKDDGPFKKVILVMSHDTAG